MSATVTVPAPPPLHSGPIPVRGGPRREASAGVEPVNSQDRGGRVLFEVRFRSLMSDDDLARLRSLLDLSTHMHPKLRPDRNSPGVARLDHFSGLFLEPGPQAGEWLLQARTWGTPAPQAIHGWHVLAALGARTLDPGVSLPGHLTTEEISR